MIHDYSRTGRLLQVQQFSFIFFIHTMTKKLTMKEMISTALKIGAFKKQRKAEGKRVDARAEGDHSER